MNPSRPPSAFSRFAARLARSRTDTTRKFALVLAALLLITDHAWPRTGLLLTFLNTLGLILVGIGTLGRVWAAMYISGYKEQALVTEGAYSIVRNPLYLFSFIGAVGVGCATGSLVLIGLLILGFFLYYPLTTLDEEQHLAALHGQAYTDYLHRTPRFIPNFALFHEGETYPVNTRTYRRAFLDAVWFVWIYALLQLLDRLHAAGLLPALLRIP